MVSLLMMGCICKGGNFGKNGLLVLEKCGIIKVL